MLSKIQALLPGHPWKDRIQYFESIDSTNTYAKRLAISGAPAGTVIMALQQTGGRGRLGRSFSSPANMGVYLSVILRPDCDPQELMHLTCAAGLAAVSAIGDPNIGIKWTNDLVKGKRKLGGILTELQVDPVTGKAAWVIVGIGINCCQRAEDFPEEIRDMACSLGMDWQDVPQLVAALIRSLYQMSKDLLPQKARIMEAFRGRCVTVGQEISVLRGELVRHGKALSIGNDGELIVQFTDGNTEAVASGEVSIRGMYGYI